MFRRALRPHASISGAGTNTTPGLLPLQQEPVRSGRRWERNYDGASPGFERLSPEFFSTRAEGYEFQAIGGRTEADRTFDRFGGIWGQWDLGSEWDLWDLGSERH